MKLMLIGCLLLLNIITYFSMKVELDNKDLEIEESKKELYNINKRVDIMFNRNDLNCPLIDSLESENRFLKIMLYGKISR